ncbi:hypothetical protein LSH36_128g04023 [Paralvinella palmiformis]|uniref:Uncharacterized protein n=1 Tax=Paralvinella palmiformis TaxID=53620 RepID=A0AAD9JWJ4_9ANNE|nr:hypothetical protein LSH36_128g04023 [Paralvinella palmiformis]
MQRMRVALQQDDPDLIVYGCSAHWLNLLDQDLTAQSVMKHIVEMQKYFRNHHKPCAWLTECLDSHKPQLPGETRWKWPLTRLDSYITNRPSYMEIVQDHEGEIDQESPRHQPSSEMRRTWLISYDLLPALLIVAK